MTPVCVTPRGVRARRSRCKCLSNGAPHGTPRRVRKRVTRAGARRPHVRGGPAVRGATSEHVELGGLRGRTP
eukprot:1692821-Prymnesium_polylepis.2